MIMIRIIKLGLVSVLRFDCVVAPAVNHTSIEDIMMTQTNTPRQSFPGASAARTVFLAALFGLSAAPALAAECQITYSDYEEGIPHVDLAVCPDNKPDEDTGFCRLAFDGMKATVIAFHYKGDDACLAGVKQYSVKQFLTK